MTGNSPASWPGGGVWPAGLPPGYPVKLAVEWCLAWLALLLLWPLLLAIAILVARDSPGPVFFAQWRLGRHGIPFMMYKFRTLRWAPGTGPRLRPDGSTEVLADDDRVTHTGRWLRGGLDELPQLWNVLRGEMTVIGPRPDEPFQAVFYALEERRKLAVPPGITGLPQVSGRADIPWKERIRMDLEYLDSYSWRADWSILWRTFATILDSTTSGRSA